MTYSLRQRLSKKQPTSENGSANHSGSRPSSSGSSSDDFEAILTRKSKKRDSTVSVKSSSVSPPPPERSLARRPDQDEATSDSEAATSSAQPALANSHVERGEDDLDAFLAQFPRSMNLSTTETKLPVDAREVAETRTVSGVQFEMLHKGKIVEGPTTTEPQAAAAATNGARITRSQSRRQQRVDSVNSAPAVKDFATKEEHLETSETADRSGKPASLTLFSPSPLSPNLTAPPSPDELTMSPISRSSLTHRPGPQASSVADSKIVHNIPAEHQADPLLSPLPLHLNPSRKSDTENYVIYPTPVLPPIPAKDTPPYSIWTSPSSANSRPIEAWLPAKRWTCCMCTFRDSQRPAAQTIVEQRICSRVECGHERCKTGCNVNVGVAFMGY